MFVSIDKLKPVLAFLSTIDKKFESDYPIFESALDIELRNKEKLRASERNTRIENDVDLIELLGGTWAGSGPGPSNESQRKSSITIEPTNSKVTRNKSLNIVSHLISTRKTVKTKNEGSGTSPQNKGNFFYVFIIFLIMFDVEN